MSATPLRRVLVTGATGFIGGRLCEVMTLTGAFTPRAFVHCSGNAWRIARYPMEFASGDLCDAESVDRAMRGCEAVVHLASGGQAVMRRGLGNVLQAALRHGVRRFVHISSLAVYGNKPPPASTTEACPARRTELPYGNEKLEQEHRVLRYGKRHGLEVVILRPPNVYGPFSHFTTSVIDALRTGTLAIVDGGRNPCNLVYVDNLVEAILLALWRPEAPGEIFFVTDRKLVSWERCLTDHAALAGVDVARVDATALVRSPRERVVRDSLRALPRVLVDPAFRRALARIPACRRVNDALYRWFTSLSAETQQAIRLLLRGPEVVGHNGSSTPRVSADFRLIASQQRTVAHSCEKAIRRLGYSAPVSYEEGMRLTALWLRDARIVEAPRERVNAPAPC